MTEMIFKLFNNDNIAEILLRFDDEEEGTTNQPTISKSIRKTNRFILKGSASPMKHIRTKLSKEMDYNINNY